MLTIPKQDGFEFDEPTHIGTANGARVLSITQVLSDVGISPDFSAINRGVLASAATRGTYAHSLTQFYDEDDLGDVPDGFQGYLDAWIKFRKESGFVPNFIEHTIYHPVYRFFGRPDRGGILDGSMAGVEVKTGEGSTLGDWVGVQLAAQAILLEDIVKTGPIKTRIAVKLHADGTYTQREYKDHRDRGVFLAAVSVANWKLGRK